MNLIELTRKLISIPSENGKEEEIADFVAEQLDWPEIVLQEIGGCGPNVIANIFVDEKAPTIVLNGHIDTVPVCRDWKRAPLEGKIEGNRLYGLGALDMKAGVAILIDVFRTLRDDCKVNLIATFTTDEEGISKGAYLLLKEMKINGDLCLIPEPSGETIRVGAKGRYVIDVELFGKSAHGARPRLGINAISDSAKVLENLNNIKIRTHPKLGEGSVCPLKIEGGGDSLSVPDYCKIRVDRHVVLGENKKIIMSDFKKALKTKSNLKISFMKRDTPFLEPYLVNLENPMVKRFVETCKKIYGKRIPLTYGMSVGDYNLFAKEIPTLVFGPKGDNLHSADEYVLIDSMIRCRDLYLSFLRRLG